MFEFLIAYWDSVLFVVLVILGLIFLAKKGATRQVNDILFYLVNLAEKEFGNGTGILKYSAVTTWVYERLPAITRILFTAKQIDEMIEDAVVRMKEYLENNSHARVMIVKK